MNCPKLMVRTVDDPILKGSNSPSEIKGGEFGDLLANAEEVMGSLIIKVRGVDDLEREVDDPNISPLVDLFLAILAVNDSLNFFEGR